MRWTGIAVCAMLGLGGCLGTPGGEAGTGATPAPLLASYMDCGWATGPPHATCDERNGTRYLQLETSLQSPSDWRCVHEYPVLADLGSWLPGDPAWKVYVRQAPLDLGVGFQVAVGVDSGRLPGPLATYVDVRQPQDAATSEPPLLWWREASNRSFMPIPRAFTAPDLDVTLDVVVVQDGFDRGPAPDPSGGLLLEDQRRSNRSVLHSEGWAVDVVSQGYGRHPQPNGTFDVLAPTAVVWSAADRRYLPVAVFPQGGTFEDPSSHERTAVGYSYSTTAPLRQQWTNVTEGPVTVKVLRQQPLHFLVFIEDLADPLHQTCCSDTPPGPEYIERCLPV